MWLHSLTNFMVAALLSHGLQRYHSFGLLSTADAQEEEGLKEFSEVVSDKTTKARSVLPNVVIFLADDLGYGDLEGLFGHPTSSTPHLNELAAKSKVFSNFYVAAPVCSPSRYCPLALKNIYLTQNMFK